MNMERKSWEEFRASGLLWFVNRILHIFGYAIVIETNDTDTQVTDCYPARVSFRGFSEATEERGYLAVSKLMKELAPELVAEAADFSPPIPVIEKVPTSPITPAQKESDALSKA